MRFFAFERSKQGHFGAILKTFRPHHFWGSPGVRNICISTAKTASTQTLFSRDIQNQITSGFLQSKDGETSNLAQCSKHLPQHFWGFAATLKPLGNFQLK